MSSLLESPVERTGTDLRVDWRIHRELAVASLGLFLFDLLGCRLAHVEIPVFFPILGTYVVMAAGLQALPVYWHSKGKRELRDASSMIIWFGLFVILLPYAQDVAGRLDVALGLQDENFTRIDRMLGISVPHMMTWASSTWLGHLVNASYPLLIPYAYVAFLFSALGGKVKRAQEFVIANFVALFISIPIFVLWPAVGPWVGYHFSPNPWQAQCQSDLLHIRGLGSYVHHPAGVVCLPSGHTMESIFAGVVTWDFRWLRIPSIVLCLSIILSTMTTGWHYFIDVLGGALVAFAALALARWLVNQASN